MPLEVLSLSKDEVGLRSTISSIMSKRDYFDQQYQNATENIIPFIDAIFPISDQHTVLDIGCGVGGVLSSFLQIGNTVTGIDISEYKISLSKEHIDHEFQKKLTLIKQDMSEKPLKTKEKYDLIVLKDVVEHIENKSVFFEHIHSLLNQNGIVFMSFPPWHMPFGGHQQSCKSFILSHTPYLHLLPIQIYKYLLNLFKENDGKQSWLIQTRKTGLSIESFENLIQRNKFKIVKRQLYLINPIYKYRFNMPTIKLPGFLNIPYIRNFYTTCGYYLIEKL